jgi:16S rRNA (guanine966-N2)-methyltransferase
MRIISGKYKGRHLTSFSANHLRPTMDRVKETIFNKCMHYIDEAKVLDLFSGTGNLGIEAISRGAAHVTFVEKNIKSIQIINKNIELLKIENSFFSIKKQDVFSYLKSEKTAQFNLIFIDPPFTEKIAHLVMEALAQSSIFTDETRIVIESIKQERMDDLYGVLRCYDRLDYGDKYLSFFRVEI